MTAPSGGQASLRELAANLTGPLHTPEHAAYDDARKLWNGRVDKRPALIVRCANTEDVVQSVRWARARGLRLSVRGAGHDFAGRALCDGLVIDLSSLRAVTVDPARRVAQVQGGATAHDLIAAAEPHALVGVTGTNSTVGVAGFALGGGYGPLMGAYGLGADNIVSAQLVSADGSLLTASAEQDPELLWALRGGAGNFGVVVSLEFRLHPLQQVLAGLMVFPLEQVDEVWPKFSAFLARMPDALTVQSGFLQLPNGPLALFLAPTYCGPLADAERVLQPLRALGKPIMEKLQPMPYSALLHNLDANVPKGRHYAIRTRWLRDLAAGPVLMQGLPLPSPFSIIGLHHFHGAATRVAASDTAFALRSEHVLVELIAAWEGEQGDACVQWTERVASALAPQALPGGYINLLGDETDRVPQAFGANYDRLRTLKRKYDPHDVFHSTPGHLG